MDSGSKNHSLNQWYLGPDTLNVGCWTFWDTKAVSRCDIYGVSSKGLDVGGCEKVAIGKATFHNTRRKRFQGFQCLVDCGSFRSSNTSELQTTFARAGVSTTSP